MNNAMAHGYINAIFQNKIWHSDDFRSRNPVIQKTLWRKGATSIVERVSWGEEDHLLLL